MSYALGVTLDRPFGEVAALVRDALSRQGFGILTEIDLQATLRSRLGVEVAPQIILGACNPPLAHAALQAEASIGLLLPCNVTIRETGPSETRVESLDPHTMVELTANPALQPVAEEAATRLAAALAELGQAANPTG
ncbi:MAG TPA: DUF302 domain-containing protein [Microlunatus sp.]|nr:DUF302 domain-containing protein [Microlunatus sp.]